MSRRISAVRHVAGAVRAREVLSHGSRADTLSPVTLSSSADRARRAARGRMVRPRWPLLQRYVRIAHCAAQPPHGWWKSPTHRLPQPAVGPARPGTPRSLPPALVTKQSPPVHSGTAGPSECTRGTPSSQAKRCRNRSRFFSPRSSALAPIRSGYRPRYLGHFSGQELEIPQTATPVQPCDTSITSSAVAVPPPLQLRRRLVAYIGHCAKLFAVRCQAPPPKADTPCFVLDQFHFASSGTPSVRCARNFPAPRAWGCAGPLPECGSWPPTGHYRPPVSVVQSTFR